MPKRLLRDWTDSDRFDGLSANAERLFVRLIMKADDYGRFHAENRRVKSACFPLLNDLRPSDLDGWLNELEARRLVWRYEVNGTKLLVIPRFGQRLKKSVAKFPAPNGKPEDWQCDDFPDVPGSSGKFREVPGTSGKFPPEVEVEVEGEASSEGSDDDTPYTQLESVKWFSWSTLNPSVRNEMQTYCRSLGVPRVIEVMRDAERRSTTKLPPVYLDYSRKMLASKCADAVTKLSTPKSPARSWEADN